ncbi:hypothetical protein PVAP13_6NG168800 [Panicum virgatum]|uniref:Uncharacterized protein n=1 Tax=Panicum virgatum TaxID=38727 RepID=A0A8T0QYH9_PANVG|nr:hypothetical protein PVAP13_6NG168800 [Panicum virgatum]
MHNIYLSPIPKPYPFNPPPPHRTCTDQPVAGGLSAGLHCPHLHLVEPSTLRHSILHTLSEHRACGVRLGGADAHARAWSGSACVRGRHQPAPAAALQEQAAGVGTWANDVNGNLAEASSRRKQRQHRPQ